MPEAESIAESIATLAVALVEELIAAGKTVATAESCSGGWIAKSITDVAGSSGCFGFGLVTYSDEAKQSLLGVSASTLREHGAVSEATVREMAEGALELSGADLSIAVSGIAGPDGGSTEKPIGTVWFAWSSRSGDGARTSAERPPLGGDRDRVRSQTVAIALQGLRERLRNGG